MGKTNQSAEALEDEIIDTSEEDKVVSDDNDDSETSEQETESEDKEESQEEQEEANAVKLSDFTRTKDVLHRVASRLLGDSDLLSKISEEDPKLLERIKAEFPKKFKDIVIPKKEFTDADIEARIEAAVEKRLNQSNETKSLSDLRTELGMSEMEFNDIKDKLAQEADRYLELELAGTKQEAYELALKHINNGKYKTLIEKRMLKELSGKQKVSSKGSGSKGTTKKFSKIVLENWKKMGFKDPEEMVKYQTKGSTIDIAGSVGKKR